MGALSVHLPTTANASLLEGAWLARLEVLRELERPWPRRCMVGKFAQRTVAHYDLTQTTEREEARSAYFLAKGT